LTVEGQAEHLDVLREFCEQPLGPVVFGLPDVGRLIEDRSRVAIVREQRIGADGGVLLGGRGTQVTVVRGGGLLAGRGAGRYRGGERQPGREGLRGAAYSGGRAEGVAQSRRRAGLQRHHWQRDGAGEEGT